jgi:hypothetical protein
VTIISDDDNDNTDFPIKYLKQQHLLGIPPYLTKLKVVASVILLGDLDPKRGSLNGKRSVVQHQHANFNTAETTTYSTKVNVFSFLEFTYKQV